MHDISLLFYPLGIKTAKSGIIKNLLQFFLKDKILRYHKFNPTIKFITSRYEPTAATSRKEQENRHNI